MKSRFSLGLGALVLAMALGGCAGSPSTSSSTPAGSSAASSAPASPSASSGAPSDMPSASAAEMKVASSSAGQIVVDNQGMSLYFFTKDVKDSGKSACVDACLAAWPVFTTTSDAPSADGVTGTVGTIDTPDGKKQVTLNGMPLYYYAQDKAPGDVNGQGVNNVWYLVSPSGEMIKGAATGY